MKFRRSVLRSVLGAACMSALATSSAQAADKSFLVGNGSWSTVGNWNPLGVPTPADNAYIGNTVTATNGWAQLNVNASVANLVITDGMALHTNAFTFTVGGVTSLSGRNLAASGMTYASRIRVENGAAATDFRTTNLVASDESRVWIAGGTLRVDDLMDMQQTSSIDGFGTINLYGNGATALRLNGQLDPDGTGLTINQLGAGRIDLDGNIADDGLISLISGNQDGTGATSLTINGDALTDAYNERIYIRGGSTLDMNLSQGWTLGNGGVIEFFAPLTGAEHAHIDGTHLTVDGHLNARAYSTAHIDAPVTLRGTAAVGEQAAMWFTGAATIDGLDIEFSSLSVADFSGATTVIGGTFRSATPNVWGGGAVFAGATNWRGTVTFEDVGLVHEGVQTVSLASAINAPVANMDGDGNTQWIINAPLDMNVNWIDTNDNTFEGSMAINSNNVLTPAYIDMDTFYNTWSMNGTLAVNGPGGGLIAQTVRGDDMILNGALNVSGGNSFGAKLRVGATGVATIAAGGSIRIDGGTIENPNRINGGSIVGAGTLRATTGHALAGYGTINTPIAFTGNAELRAKDGLLNINGAIQDVGVIGTADSTGVLQVNTAWNTNVADRVELLGGQLRGAALTNSGQIVGHGLIFVNTLVSGGTIAAQGGELIVNTAFDSIDLDGPIGAGIIRAQDGNLTIGDQPTGFFQGVAHVGAGRVLSFPSDWYLGGDGVLSLQGAPGTPATVAGGFQWLAGRVQVSGPAAFDIQTTFASTATVQTTAASDSITLMRDAYVYDGTLFTGPGLLRNASGRVLSTSMDAAIGIRVVNEGTFRPSYLLPGIVNVHGYDQTETGQLQLKLSGPTPGGQYDRVNVSTNALLNGRIDLTVDVGYDPVYLVSHEVLRANAVQGMFDTVAGQVLSPTKYLAVTYDADSVLVTAAIPGDANLDGNVNFDDLLTLAQNYDQIGESWTTGDFTGNGAVTFDDLLLTAQNYGSHLLSGNVLGVDRSVSFHSDWAMAQSMVPEPAALATLLLVVPRCLRRRA